MKTIEFTIVYAKNHSIHQMGYVEIPVDKEEDVEWYYYDQSGFTIPKVFTHHNDVGITQIGATSEQQAEIDKFVELTQVDFVDFVQECIVLSDEEENEVYRKGDLIIMVGDECKAVVRDLDVYGIAYNIAKENLLESDDPAQAMNEGLLDKLANNWEQSFEEWSLGELLNLTGEDVEKEIRDYRDE